MLLDMPQSLCALDHAGTGKEGSSAKRCKIVSDDYAGGEREKMCRLHHQPDRGQVDTHSEFALVFSQCESKGVSTLISKPSQIHLL